MDFENDIVHINNAYKDWEVYDDNMVKIGHRRGDGELKTSESYRDIPMHPRLKRLLLMINKYYLPCKLQSQKSFR